MSANSANSGNSWLRTRAEALVRAIFRVDPPGDGRRKVGSGNVQGLSRLEETIPSDPGPERILVIGGAGFIGSALVAKLLDRGYHVRVLDQFSGGTGSFGEHTSNAYLDWSEGDFRRASTVLEAMRGMDAVVHLGAVLNVVQGAGDDQTTADAAAITSAMIAECAKKCGIRRFVLASSCAVYGNGEKPVDESSPLRGSTRFAKSKVAAEQAVRNFSDARFKPTLLRFGAVYGCSGRTRFDVVLNLMTAQAVTGGEIYIGSADEWRPFIHVEDAAAAILKVLEARIEQVGGEIFNVGGNGQNVALGNIADTIRDIVPGTKTIVDSSRGGDSGYRVDFTKIERRLGFQPEWTVERGIKQLVHAMASGRVADYHDPRHSNRHCVIEDVAVDRIRQSSGTDTPKSVNRPLLY